MWVYLPNFESFPCVAEAGDSIEALPWRSQLLEQSVTWRETSLPAKSWQAKWKRDAWTRRLFGRILKPSTATLGVESWIASLVATRANPSAWPANDLERTIQDTFGPTWRESLRKRNPLLCSLKTSQDTSLLGGMWSEATSEEWATALRQDSLRRRKSARLTRGLGSSSSESWMTPHGMANKDKHGKQGMGGEFALQAQRWPTPVANDDNKSMEAHLAMKSRMKGGPRTQPTSLQVVAKNWHTPTTEDGKRDGDKTLLNYGETTFSQRLRNQAAVWGTPRSSDGEKGGPNQAFGSGSVPLSSQVCLFSLPVQPTSMDGEESSKSDPTSRRRLNPMFVCWLMGWPLGSTSFEPSETEWFHWRERMHSSLFSLVRGNER